MEKDANESWDDTKTLVFAGPSKWAVAIMFFLAMFQTVAAQSPMTSVSDEIAIKQTAMDYIERWNEGDAARMQRALHPELAKRMVSPDFSRPKPAESNERNGSTTLKKSNSMGSGRLSMFFGN